VELAKAFLYSSLTNTTVNMPLDGKVHEQELRKLIACQEVRAYSVNSNFAKSFR
jgi:hypothetical protein